MNNSQQAKNGLRTFLFVLTVSLGVFGVFYYVTSQQTANIDIETHSTQTSDVLSYNTQQDNNAFKKLATEKVDVPSRAVLAGTDSIIEEETGTTPGATTTAEPETPESTTSVPDTGISTITWGLFISTVILATGGYILYLNPRNLALSHFEKDF